MPVGFGFHSSKATRQDRFETKGLVCLTCGQECAFYFSADGAKRRFTFSFGADCLGASTPVETKARGIEIFDFNQSRGQRRGARGD